MHNYLISFFVTLSLLCSCNADPGENGNDNNTNQNNSNGTPVCGNSIIETGEGCDQGAANSDVLPNACRTDCREAYCGDDVIDSGEGCDTDNLAANSCGGLGYTKGTLACSNECTYDTSDCSTCGDGVAEGTDTESVGYETCDGTDLRLQNCLSIGQASGFLACNSNCQWDISGCTGGGPVCGNGVVEGAEECDDGNNEVTDSCPDGPAGTCMHARCGDGFVWAGVEGCDDGNGLNEDLCPDGVGGTCQLATCGDGFRFASTEECDDGTANSDTEINACRTDCRVAHCGDGIKDSTEECDGTDVGGVACSDVEPEWNNGWTTCQNNCTLDYGCCSICGDDSCYNNLCPNGLVVETQANCPADCGVCGDGICNYNGGETITCPQDCT